MLCTCPIVAEGDWLLESSESVVLPGFQTQESRAGSLAA